MGRTVTLKGPAAKAFVETLKGVKPRDEQDALRRIATQVALEVRGGGMDKAVELLQLTLKLGPRKTADLLAGT